MKIFNKIGYCRPSRGFPSLHSGIIKVLEAKEAMGNVTCIFKGHFFPFSAADVSRAILVKSNQLDWQRTSPDHLFRIQGPDPANLPCLHRQLLTFCAVCELPALSSLAMLSSSPKLSACFSIEGGFQPCDTGG